MEPCTQDVSAGSREQAGLATRVYVPLSDARPSESGLVWRTAADSPAVHAFLRTAEDQMGERSVPRTAR